MKSNGGNALELRNLDLNKLETFFVIAEAGGVSAAARRLALTRSAVSHSLTALESALGVALFQRVGRRMLLTPEGVRLRNHFREVRERLGEALGELVSSRAGVRGPVRIGLFLGFSRFRLAAVLERYLGEHPDAWVRVVYGSHAELLEQLRQGELDFTFSLRPVGRASRQVRSTRLFEQRLVLTSARRMRRLGLEALAELPIVDYYRSDPLIDRWARHHYGRKLSHSRVRAWAASTDLALELIRRGVGCGVLPGDLAEPFRKRGELYVIPGPGDPLRDHLWLNQLRGARSSPALTRLREILVAARE